jgi:hypothetical protein
MIIWKLEIWTETLIWESLYDLTVDINNVLFHKMIQQIDIFNILFQI